MSNRSTSIWRERLASPLTWHIAAVATLAVMVVTLVIVVGLDLAGTSSRSTEALAGKQLELKVLDKETAPLRGLEMRVADSRAQMQAFYTKRIPANYSSIATRIGELEVNSGVRLSRVQYSQGLPGVDLTEISMDAGISGDYRQIMRFVNALERDQTFFVIRAMTLAGQQGGSVNLRLRVSSWMRPADAAASGLPTTQESDRTTSPLAASGKEGE
jgi:type IV pilus assembly protein PilO